MHAEQDQYQAAPRVVVYEVPEQVADYLVDCSVL